MDCLTNGEIAVSHFKYVILLQGAFVELFLNAKHVYVTHYRNSSSHYLWCVDWQETPQHVYLVMEVSQSISSTVCCSRNWWYLLKRV